MKVKSTFFILFLLYFIFMGTFAASKSRPKILKRIDPHGTKEMDPKLITLRGHKECSVCHVDQPEKWSLKDDIPGRCILCHLSRPHSGILEHEKKILRLKESSPEKITCLSCHFPHRYSAAKSIGPTNAKRFHELAREKIVIPEGLIEKSNPTPMLRRTCEECHSW